VDALPKSWGCSLVLSLRLRILSGMFNLHDVIEAAPLGDHHRNARLLEIVTA
jgi:hypothetical protein